MDLGMTKRAKRYIDIIKPAIKLSPANSPCQRHLEQLSDRIHNHSLSESGNAGWNLFSKVVTSIVGSSEVAPAPAPAPAPAVSRPLIDIIKDPYILEFLGLEESAKYTEKQLETAILDNLQHFLLEMGKGFTFVARQKRLTFEDKHYYADIVLFNRILNCFVIIDLKIDKLSHGDVGQMEMYTNYYDMEEKLDTENPTIGLILCPEKDKAILKYVINQKSQIFASQYSLVIPNEDELTKLIQKTKLQIKE